METRITDEIIARTAALAKLDLSEAEAKQARQDMARMLSYINQLNDLDTTGVEPLFHLFPVHNVFREDAVAGPDMHRQMLSNAPAQKDGCFQVPRTVEPEPKAEGGSQ